MQSTPSTPTNEPALRVSEVSKDYGSGTSVTHALDGVSLALPRGSFTAIMGPSGSGKSTLLHCSSGLDRPTRGKVLIDGQVMPYGDETTLTEFRRERIGFVFQHLNLLPTLTVLQNVALPMRLAGRKPYPRRCREVLARMGLDDERDKRPAQLSGGQQQRVAIARAVVSSPQVLFADEPTGALDRGSARQVLELLSETIETYGQTVVMVTHDPVAAAYAHRVLFLTDGRIVDDLDRPGAAEIGERMTSLSEAAAARVHNADRRAS